jgi:glutamate racemase
MSASGPSRSAPATPFPALAVLDWGIGGFGFVAALQRHFPGVAYTYFSDSGFTPYGKTRSDELATRLAQIAAYLHDNGARHLIIACNAASTVVAQTAWPTGLRVDDVISAGLELVLAQPQPRPVMRLGIVGGKRTIRSQALAAPLRAAGYCVIQRVAQPLSAHIERGDLQSAALLQDLDRIVQPLRGVDALLLACTHYPAIAHLFAARLPGTTMIDPVHALLQRVQQVNQVRQLPSGMARLLTSGDRLALVQGAAAAFGVMLDADVVQCVHIV